MTAVHLSTRTLPLDQLEWLRDRQLDPNGRIFRYEGEIYRAIYPTQVAHIRQLFSRGIVQQLIDSGLLIGTELTDLKVGGFGLVLKHRRLSWRTKAFEWPRSLLRDAALKTLDLNLALLPYELGTVDGHGSNVGLLNGCAPVWVDFGSIMPIANRVTPLPEFRRFFLHPLRLLSRAPGANGAVRDLLRGGGLDDESANSLFDPRFSSSWVKRRLRERRQRSQSREQLLRAERERIVALDLPLPKTLWTEYHQAALPLFPESYDDLECDSRRAAIFGVLRKLKPKRVIDLAANAGFFSFYAARQGAEVLAVDYDEAAVEHCYTAAREHGRNLPIACICGDVMQPAPVERSADFVLALALVHHLSLSQGYTFDAIVAALAAPCTGTLLVEFMPNGLGGTFPKPDPLPDWYRVGNFQRCLEARFARVETIEYPVDPSRNRRILILAQDPRDLPLRPTQTASFP